MVENELRECREHGFFRGESCPVCGERGRLLMDRRELDSISRILAGMLRHFPERYGIRLDDHGWAKIYPIIAAIRAERRGYGWLTPRHIEALIRTDDRHRYSINNRGEIRANYGHTIPVEMDDLPDDDIPEKLYYQTTLEEKDLIKEAGISPSDRTWVHISKTYRQAFVSGLFHVDDPEVLEIDSGSFIGSGGRIFRANDDIFLTREIPPRFIREADKEDVELTQEEKDEISRVKERRARRRSQRY